MATLNDPLTEEQRGKLTEDLAVALGYQNEAPEEEELASAIDAGIEDKPFVPPDPVKAPDNFAGSLDGKNVYKDKFGGLVDDQGNKVDAPEGLAGEFKRKEVVTENADGTVTIENPNGGSVSMPAEKWAEIQKRRAGAADTTPAPAAGKGKALSDDLGDVDPATVVEDGEVVEESSRDQQHASLVEATQKQIDQLAGQDPEKEPNGLRRGIKSANQIEFAKETRDVLASYTNSVTDQPLSLRDLTPEELRQYRAAARKVQSDPFGYRAGRYDGDMERFFKGVSDRIGREQETRTRRAKDLQTRKEDLAMGAEEAKNDLVALETTYRNDPSKENLGNLQKRLSVEAEIAEGKKLASGTERDYSTEMERIDRSLIATERSLSDIQQKASDAARKEIEENGYIVGEDDQAIAEINSRYAKQAQQLSVGLVKIKGRLEKAHAGFSKLHRKKGSEELREDSAVNVARDAAAAEKGGLPDDPAAATEKIQTVARGYAITEAEKTAVSNSVVDFIGKLNDESMNLRYSEGRLYDALKEAKGDTFADEETFNKFFEDSLREGIKGLQAEKRILEEKQRKAKAGGRKLDKAELRELEEIRKRMRFLKKQKPVSGRQMLKDAWAKEAERMKLEPSIVNGISTATGRPVFTGM